MTLVVGSNLSKRTAEDALFVERERRPRRVFERPSRFAVIKLRASRRARSQEIDRVRTPREVRIATFNLETFGETAVGEWPSLAEQIQLMRPQIVRLRGPTLSRQQTSLAIRGCGDSGESRDE